MEQLGSLSWLLEVIRSIGYLRLLISDPY